jgi:hypothetical protein
MAQELRTNINFNFQLYKLDFTCSFLHATVWNECGILSVSLSDDFENNIQTLIAIMIFGGFAVLYRSEHKKLLDDLPMT